MKNTHNPLFIFTAAMLVVLFFLCQCSNSNEIPDHLIGTWTSESEKYMDRYLHFDPKTITFGTGGYGFQTYIIVNLEKEKNDKENFSYHISYEDAEGNDFKVGLLYDSGNNKIISLGNTLSSWHKTQ